MKKMELLKTEERIIDEQSIRRRGNLLRFIGPAPPSALGENGQATIGTRP